jgi:hypothetical protein
VRRFLDTEAVDSSDDGHSTDSEEDESDGASYPYFLY